MLLYTSIIMEFTISDQAKASQFAFLFQNIRVFTETINFVCESDHMFVQSMDSANVMLFEVKIQKDWFDEYKVESNINIGINTAILSKLLSVREKGHTLQFMHSSSDSDKLDISFTSEDKNVYNKDFTIPLVELESSLLGIEEQDSNAQFSMPSANFQNIINQLRMFGDCLSIKCDENAIKLGSQSQDIGEMEVNIDINDLHEFEIVPDLELNLNFTLHYLANISQFSKVSKDVELRFIENFPMQIVYYLDENEHQLENSISFFLAPQIDNN